VLPAAPGDEKRGSMRDDFKVGDHVEWNSEAGMVIGTIIKKVTSEITFKGYKVHASEDEPQYLIKSDKTDHEAMHKGSALKKIKSAKKHPSSADEKKS
jgi:hypothetical protein